MLQLLDAPLTKRRLGWLILVCAALLAAAMVGADVFGAGLDRGFGPAQQAGLAAAAAAAAFALTLLPLGGRASAPATRVSPLAAAPAEAGAQAGVPRLWAAAARLLFGLTLAVFAAYVLIYFNYAFALFRFPFDYDQGEGFELNDTILFARGEWPYRDNEVYPFYASNYPPLFHLLAVPLVWLFGPTYWTGRALSFLATLLTAAAIGWAVWRESGRRGIALLSGLAFLSSNYVYHVGPLFRQHMTMVMFEMLAIAALAALPDSPHARRGAFAGLSAPRLLFALLCLLLAGYTKQLAISTVAAAFVFLFLRGPRRAVLAGLGFALVAGALFLAIDLATRGQWWLNIILANVNEYDVERALALYRQWFSLHLILILAAAAWAVYELYWARLSAFSIWFAFATANAALAGKWGAGESYFTTAVAAACVCSGLAFAALQNQAGGWPAGRAALLALALPGLYLLQAARLLHMPTTGPVFGPAARALGLPADSAYYDSQGYTQLGRPPGAADIAAGQRILAHVQAAPGPVLSEEAAFPILAGKDVVTNPTQLLNLYNNGLYDPASLMQAIGSQEFGVVVLRAQFYPQPVLDAIGAAYEPLEEVEMNGFTYRVLRPRQSLENMSGR